MLRKQFIKTGLFSSLGIVLAPPALASDDPSPSIIKEFVLAGHNDIEKLKSLLNDDPRLMYTRHHWGNGDFESAIEGAGHVGNIEIVKYLIEKGARPNIFTLASLGENQIVKSLLQRFPELLFSKGPHGFTLLHHAKVGADDSGELHEFLIESGLNKYKLPLH